MTFASIGFLIFFVVLMLLRRVVAVPMKLWVLLIGSYVFYISGSVAGVALIIATSLVDYHVGKALAATEDVGARKRWLFLSLAFNLGILAFFKYTNFLLENAIAILNMFGFALASHRLDIPLPPGISYFTFSSLSYVLDIYYERALPTYKLSEYLLYVAYFPKLLAGPIARAEGFFEQVRENMRASAADIEVGALYFMLGAVKKIVIADQLGPHVDLIFANPGRYDAFTLIQGVLGYAVQIYCDFSGYTDMAVGCARIMGIHLPQNFALPYNAASIADFWRRWHITLSTWFRDYVFLPLEMATKSTEYATLRASMNLVVTMGLCGLWHGASWNFVVWGGIHGVALAVNRAWRVSHPRGASDRSPGFRLIANLSARALTLTVVMIGWVFFRAESWGPAMEYLRGIVTWRHGLRVVSPYILAGVALIFAVHLIFYKGRDWAEEIPQLAFPVRVAAYSCLVLLLSTLGGAESAPFLYFQF